MANSTYIPSTQDILHMRQVTTGVVEFELDYKGQHITLLDVGRQKGERKKWIHQFDRCIAVLLVAALSDYGQLSVDDQ